MLAVVSALAILVAYAIARYYFYFYLPAIEGSQWQWLARDTLLDLPRLLGSALAVFFIVRFLGRTALGHPMEGAKSNIVCVWVAFCIAPVLSLLSIRPPEITPEALFMMVASSFILAIFEELTMRGLLTRGLAELMSPLKAAFVAALVYTLLHIQSTPLRVWPLLFAIGLVASAARLVGVGLGWLVLAHGVGDSLHLMIGTDSFWVIPATIVVFVLAPAVRPVRPEPLEAVANG
jgi:membrane protease YdiL (CAAX protease family)